METSVLSVIYGQRLEAPQEALEYHSLKVEFGDTNPGLQERIINKSAQLPIASVDMALSGAKC